MPRQRFIPLQPGARAGERLTRFEEKAGQARDIESVGRTGFREDECIRMANGPASSDWSWSCYGHQVRMPATAARRFPWCIRSLYPAVSPSWVLAAGRVVYPSHERSPGHPFESQLVPYPVRLTGELYL